MKRGKLLNAPLSALVAQMGHTDEITVCDAGLPIAAGPERIDLALMAGTPSLVTVLTALLTDLVVEKVIMASEIKLISPDAHQALVVSATPANHQTAAVWRMLGHGLRNSFSGECAQTCLHIIGRQRCLGKNRWESTCLTSSPDGIKWALPTRTATPRSFTSSRSRWSRPSAI